MAKRNLKSHHVKELTDYFWKELKKRFRNQVVLNGHPQLKLPNTLNVSFVNKSGQAILDCIPDVAASTGSACHADKVDYLKF